MSDLLYAAVWTGVDLQAPMLNELLADASAALARSSSSRRSARAGGAGSPATGAHDDPAPLMTAEARPRGALGPTLRDLRLPPFSKCRRKGSAPVYLIPGH